MVRTDRQKIDSRRVFETKQNPIILVNTKTPHLAIFRVEFFCLQSLMKRIAAKERFTPLGFLLNMRRQLLVAALKFLRIVDRERAHE